LSIPRFTARELQGRDVSECFSFDFSHLGAEILGAQRAIDVWKSLIETASFRSTVIESGLPVNGYNIVGFAARVFVSRGFAESELADPRPGLCARLVAGIAEGQPLALTESQVRHANTYSGLHAVILGGFRNKVLSQEALSAAAAILSARFFETHSGYWLYRLITEIATQEYKDFLLAARVWRIASNFETFYARQPDSEWSKGRALAVIGRDEAMAIMSHPIGPLFLPKKPRLKLRDADQQFLRVAAAGLTDEDLSRELGVSISSIKKRWLSIYERISENHPDFFPQKDGAVAEGTRGRQKRHLIIAHVRAHPEELCPFQW
jgi:hypothetical protein